MRLSTSPAVGFLLALVAALAAAVRLPAQATTPPNLPPRTTHVRLEQSISITGVRWWAEWHVERGPVRGVMWVETGEVNRSFVQEAFGCTPRRRGDEPDRWRCRVAFVHGEPAWAALLQALEAGSIANPPPGTEVMAPDSTRDRRMMTITMCTDGSPWRVTWRGAAGAAPVHTAQGCGSLSPARQAFERDVASVVGTLLHAADPSAAP